MQQKSFSKVKKMRNSKLTQPHTSEHGSAMVVILVAVALFVAIAFTFTRTTGNSSNSVMTLGQAKLEANQVINYATSIERSVARLLTRGCSESDISFENDVVSGYEHTPAAEDRCKVFHPDGGNMTWRSPENNINDGSEWIFVSTANIQDLGIAGGELMMILPNVSREMCMAVNTEVNVPLTDGEPPQDLSVGYTNVKFTGTFSSSYQIRDTTGDKNLDGKQTACFEGGGTPNTGTYHFYHAVLVR